MRDYSGDLTDERLAQLERRIAAVYKQARDDLDKEVKDYFAKFQQRDDEMRRLVGAGEFSREEYKQWRLTQMGRGQRFEALRDKMAERFTHANEVALSYVNYLTSGIYCENRNYEAYQIERTVGNCDFTLFNEAAVRRLIVEQPDVMPYYPPKRAIRRGIDLAYGKDQITKRVTSGILRGLSPGKIANELMQGITGMNRESALRAARTGITAAQNAGRMDSYVAAQRIGVKIRRRWVCAKDLRTRDAHALADGQTVEGTDTPFEVGGEKLMFPGDTSRGASGWNIYNCRCHMRTVEKDGIEAEPRQMRVRNPVTGKNELVNEMTYQEWREWKMAEKSGAFGVGSPKTDLQYINSEAYKKKFDSISDNRELNSAIYKRCKAAVTHQSGGYYEDLSILDTSGKLIGNTSGVSENETLYTAALKEMISKRPPYSLVSIHNHGTNVPPSGADLASAGYRKYAFGIVACHSGSVYYYDTSKARPFLPELFDRKVDKYRELPYSMDVARAFETALDEMKRDYGIDWREIK